MGDPLRYRMLYTGTILLTLSACDVDRSPDGVERLADASTVDGSANGDSGFADATVMASPDASASSKYLFQIVDDFDDLGARAPGWICPVGLCSWFCGPAGSGPGAKGFADVEDPIPARGNSKGAWHLRTGASSPGVEVKLDIHGPGFPAVLYPNLENYAGVAFWARSDLDDQTLLVAIEDDKVIATSYEVAARSKPWFTRAVKLSDRWRRYIIRFDDFQQVDSGGAVLPGRLNTKAVWSFHFLAGLDGKNSDAWVDDLALLCKGACPPPAYDLNVATTADALTDPEFEWTRSAASEPHLACAEVAELSMMPFDRWVAGPGEKVFLRARIPSAPSTPVPLWGWTVERLPGGETVPITVIDPESTIVAVPISEPGQYRIRTHTHYPAT
jgi:hypothetical protein